MEVKNGVILLFLSDYKNTTLEKEYRVRHSKSSVTYKGVQTNDAPIRYLLSKAESDGHSIGIIICVLSRKCYEEPKDKSAWYIFEEFVSEVCSELKLSIPEIVPISYDFYFKDKSSKHEILNLDSDSERSLRIYREIYHATQKFDLKYFYIDFTGGMRNISYLFTMIIKNLVWIGAECCSIAYSQFNTSEIVSINRTYNMSKIIDSVSLFINAGNPQSMIDTFYELITDENTNGYGVIKNFLETLKDFADAVSLCKIDLLDEIVNRLSSAIDDTDKLDQEEFLGNVYIEMFRSCVPEIKKSILQNNSSKISVKEIIKWCIDKRMVQQALTIFTEKMPKYYIEQKIYEPFCNLESIKPNSISSMFSLWQTESFYDNFFAIFAKPSLVECCTNKVKDIYNLSIKCDCQSRTPQNVFVSNLDSESSKLSKDEPEISLGLKNFALSIKEHFDMNNWSQKNKARCIKPYDNEMFYGGIKSEQINSLGAFITLLQKTDNYFAVMHYFIFNDHNKFASFKQELENTNKLFLSQNDTDAKRNRNFFYKLKSCVNLENGDISKEISNNLLSVDTSERKKIVLKVVDVMRCFAAIKFIRNQTNHAAIRTNDSMLKVIENYFLNGKFINDKFKSSLPPIDIVDISADNVIKLVKYAVELV